ncbi:MAG TPA: tripartite tricarboxylate transporter TctB family protein [Usitatibacter sp.]|nr:tripartite tricarboxylate transporter TctB family protein [Usitatibacter sp.]
MGRDGYAGLAILVASLALFWATLGLERHPMVPIGPGFYPRVILGITAAMALGLLVSDVLARRRRVVGAQAAPAGQRPNYGLVVAAFAVFTVYVLALPWLGFRLATLLFLLAMPVLLERPAGVRGWVIVALVAVVATLASHYAFESYLHVLLPRGRWTGF